MSVVVDYFVNREQELQTLRRWLESDSPNRAALIVAESGMGKTTLLDRLKEEIRTQPDSQRYQIVTINLAGLLNESTDIAIFYEMKRDLPYDVSIEVNQALAEAIHRVDAVHNSSANENTLYNSIKLLLFAAQPAGLGPIHYEEEFDKISVELAHSIYGKRFDLDTRLGGTYNTLSLALTDLKPKILHVSTHGNPDGDIVLRADDERSRPLALEKLARLGKPRCVVLNGCWTDERAHVIISSPNSTVEAVVGMTYKIGVGAAVVFAESFYRAIGDGKNLQEAVQLGKDRIEQDFPKELARPRLRVREGLSPDDIHLYEPYPSGKGELSRMVLAEKIVRAELCGKVFQALAPFTRARKTLFILDNWHHADPQTQTWLQNDSILDWINRQQLGSTTRAIVATTNAASFVLPNLPIPLGPLGEQPVVEYRDHYQIENVPPGLWSLMLEKPFYMRVIAASAQKRDFVADAKTFGDVVEALLNDPEAMSVGVARAIRCAAVVHRFDEHLLPFLLDDDRVDMATVSTILKTLGFVNAKHVRTLALHSEVRTVLLEWWFAHKNEYTQINRRALQYFQHSKPSTDEEDLVRSRELLYHQLIDAPKVGMQQLRQLFEDTWSSYKFKRERAYLDEAYAPEIVTLLDENDNAWIQYFESRLKTLSEPNNQAIKEQFENWATRATQPDLKAAAGWSVGDYHARAGRLVEAIHRYNESLKALQRTSGHEPLYELRLLMALGAAYRDLAHASGAIESEVALPFGRAGRSLLALQQAPFVAYRILQRRVSLRPMWNFGNNYSTWVITYLLLRARSCYQQARALMPGGVGTSLSTEAELALAEIEQRLGLWSHAEQHYRDVQATLESPGQSYRLAQVKLGQSRLELSRGNPEAGQITLEAALEAFQQVEEPRSIGLTTALLAQAAIMLGNLESAVTHYKESIATFETTGEYLQLTQTLWALEALSTRESLPNKARQEAHDCIKKYSDRHYVMHFPNLLLNQFRVATIVGAIPLTYVLTLLAVIFVFVAFIVLEGTLDSQLHGAFLNVTDILILIGTAVLLLLSSLWLYTAVYSMIGWAVVGFGRRTLSPLEGEPPDYFVTTPTQIIKNPYVNSKQTLDWENIGTLALIHYHLWSHQRIHLLSRLWLLPRENSGIPIEIAGVVPGYNQLVTDLLARFEQLPKNVQPPQRIEINFVVFQQLWLAIAIFIALPMTYLLRQVLPDLNIVYNPMNELALMPPLDYIVRLQRLTNQSTLSLSPLVAMFLLSLALVFPATVLWQLTLHRRLVRRIGGSLGLSGFSSLLLWGITAVWTIVVLLAFGALILSRI